MSDDKKVEEKQLKAFLDDIDALQEKYQLRLMPVLASTPYSITAQFHVEAVEEKPEEKDKNS